MSLFTSENPVFAAYSFYAALLIVKTLMMSLLTSLQRMIKRAFVNPEDAKMGKVKPKTDEDVERIRRAHLNDLENILPFLTLGLIYVGTGPSLACAKFVFRVFTAARFMHTFVYAIIVIPQPARAIAFLVGMLANAYMAYVVLTTYISAF